MEGRRQRAVRRRLIAADGGSVTTKQMVEVAHPRLDLSKTHPDWLWHDIRLIAERYAERVWPRTRPLRWKLEKDDLSAADEPKSKC